MDEVASEFHVEVVRIGVVEKHPNADTLSITQVHGGYPCIFKTGAFTEGQLAVYIPVDSLVPTSRPEFAFLAKPGHERHRVRAMRLRGIFSMGLLIPATEDQCVGASMAESLSITKYEPPMAAELRSALGPAPKKPSRNVPGMPVYGVEAYRKYKSVLKPGEMVVITEKLHGTNARYQKRNGKLYVGSHKTMRGCTRSRLAEWFNRAKLWVKSKLGIQHRAGLFQEQGDVWWQMAEKFNLKAKVPEGFTLYGEIIGPGVQKGFDYGLKEREFVLFDVLDVKADRYLEYDELNDFSLSYGFTLAPLLYWGRWGEGCLSLADGKTCYGAEHIREGIVIKAFTEREEPHFGRVSLKYVSEAYLLLKEDK